MKIIYLSCMELYERVWSKPLTENAKDLGLSDVGLAKRCRREGIPLPPQGYWLMAPGPERDALKEPLPAELQKSGRHLQFRFQPPDVAAKVQAARDEVEVNLEERGVSEGNVREANRYVRAMRAAVDVRKKDERGILECRRKLPVPLRVSPEQLDRAMTLASRLIARFLALGFAVRQSEEHAGLVSIQVRGAWYSFWLEEHSTKTERPLTAKEEKEARERPYYYIVDRWIFRPSGKIVVRLCHDLYNFGERSWSDGATAIEERSSEIVLDIVAFAESERIASEKREEEERRSRVRYLIEARRQHREMYAAMKIRHLKRQARDFAKAQMLEQYIAAVASADTLTVPALVDDEARRAWLEWASGVARSVNPITNGQACSLPPRPRLLRRSEE